MDAHDVRQELQGLFERMPYEQVERLRKLTKDRLTAQNDERMNRFIKVAYVRKSPPRAVLWESHVTLSGLDVSDSPDSSWSIAKIKDALIESLPPALKGVQAHLVFASADLEKAGMQVGLRRYLAIYCDKMYAEIDPEQIDLSPKWQTYLSYFEDTGQLVRRNPGIYTGLCHSLKQLYVQGRGPKGNDRLYQHLVLLRSLPNYLALACEDRANSNRSGGKLDLSGYAEVAESVRLLLGLLATFKSHQSEAENAEAIYSIINSLEWLAYLAPRMYSTRDGAESPPLHEALAEQLFEYISSDNYTLAIRLEAAWALGWAAVSSIPVAAYVQEKVSISKGVRALRSEVLRHVMGGAYLRASFTLASFGPARVTAGAAEKIPAGGFYHDNTELPQPSYASALNAASDVVYSQLSRYAGVQRHVPVLLAATMAALWLTINVITIAIALPRAQQPEEFAMVAPPAALLAVSTTFIAVQAARRNLGSLQRFLKTVGAILGPLFAFLVFLAELEGVIALLQSLLGWVSRLFH